MSYSKLLASIGLAFAVAAGATSVFAQDPKPTQSAAQGSAAAGLADKRIAKLEEQIVDLQVVIGTLQSLMQNQAPTAADGAAQGAFNSFGDSRGQPSSGFGGSGSAGSGVAARIDVIETQIRALTGQLDQISRQLSGGSASGSPGPGDFAPVPQEPLAPGGQPLPFDGKRGESGPTNSITIPSAFGTLTVTPRQEGIGANSRSNVSPDRVALAGPDARAIYDRAYKQLLQREFAAAEAGFQSYLTTAPTGPLAANAQYWLGETHYARGQFRVAADVFLKGYRRHRTGGKAPDSLLKLGLSLHQLGERDAACATPGELSQNFPSAPEHVRQQADRERSRVGC